MIKICGFLRPRKSERRRLFTKVDLKAARRQLEEPVDPQWRSVFEELRTSHRGKFVLLDGPRVVYSGKKKKAIERAKKLSQRKGLVVSVLED